MAEVAAGNKAGLVTPETPFYGETGGQVGDVGTVAGPAGQAKVLDAVKPGGEITVLQIEVTEGVLKQGDALTLTVDQAPRRATAANHTATHLLHAALRKVLG